MQRGGRGRGLRGREAGGGAPGGPAGIRPQTTYRSSAEGRGTSSSPRQRRDGDEIANSGAEKGEGDGRANRKDDILMTLSSFNDYLRTRPSHIVDKKGSSGEEISCVTNYIPVVTTPDWKLYQYHVTFSPSIDSKTIRHSLIHQWDDVLGKEWIFDGLILYLSFQLPNADVSDGRILTSINRRTETPVELRIKLTKKFLPGDPQCITLFNLCNRKAFQLNGFLQLGRNYYDPRKSHSINGHGIEIWPGYISAIRFQEDALLMCCEMSYKVLRVDTVRDFMKKLYNRYGKEDYMKIATQNLVGSSVLTRYNNRTYRIDDILWDKRPTEQFQSQDGTSLTFVQYYSKQYSIKIEDHNQPLLLSRAKKRGDVPPGELSSRDVHLVPELCAMTGLTDEMRNDRRMMQALARHTRVPPDRRIEYARENLHSVANSQPVQQLFSGWSLSFGEDVARVKARVLPREILVGGDEQIIQYNSASGDWARECREAKVVNGVKLNHWVFLYPKDDREKAEQFYREIQDIGNKIGMNIGEPFTVPLPYNSKAGTYLKAIKFGRGKEEKAQMVVVMVPNDNKTRYDAIKELCCLEHPIPSQVIQSQTLNKNMISVCAKIILQMNCKLGGSLWRVQIPTKKAMVIGYDVYQDSAHRGKTVGAAVFSMNPEMTQWYSECALHGESKELIHNLAFFCENGLKKYYEINGCLPEWIFLFRDGCGDGQIPVVFSDEVPQVQQAIRTVGESIRVDYKAKLTFIIVTKKINSRFFQETSHGLKNPPPGTVVDSVITRQERYDFFLVPQSVQQGTVTPVYYNVILDESGWSADEIQRLAYKLCHLYYNWQGTIRVPAPCQYAHKLAFLVAQSLHKSAHYTFLSDKLYFL